MELPALTVVVECHRQVVWLASLYTYAHNNDTIIRLQWPLKYNKLSYGRETARRSESLKIVLSLKIICNYTAK